MNKQQKIFNFIVDLAQEFGLGWNESVYLADHILTYQDKMGVVIKVDRELPTHKLKNAKLVDVSRLLYEIDEEFGKFTFTGEYRANYIRGHADAQNDMLNAGYGAFEPLVKENND